MKFVANQRDAYLDVLVPNTWLNVSPERSDGNWGYSACHMARHLNKLSLNFHSSKYKFFINFHLSGMRGMS